jgi:hypothetical protein
MVLKEQLLKRTAVKANSGGPDRRGRGLLFYIKSASRAGLF